MPKIYSHSRINTFEQCPLKFKYRYLDKIISLQRFIEMFLGNLVHETLEWLYIQIKQGKIPSIDDVVSYYSKNWTKKYDSKIIIVKNGLNVGDYFNKGLKFILDYYMKHKPFDDNTIAIEKKVFIELGGEYTIQGIIDRLVHNKEKNEYEIHDYKTANNLPRQSIIDSDRQLALYSIAIKNDFNAERIRLIWHYLAFNKKIHSTRTHEQLIQLKQETLEQIKKIENTNDFPAQKSALCNWCEYNSMCPEWGCRKIACKFGEVQGKLG